MACFDCELAKLTDGLDEKLAGLENKLSCGIGAVEKRFEQLTPIVESQTRLLQELQLVERVTSSARDVLQADFGALRNSVGELENQLSARVQALEANCYNNALAQANFEILSDSIREVSNAVSA